MGLKIVTGKRPEPHITSEDDRYRNAAIFGRYVALLDVSQHLAPSIIASNTVRINSGDIVIGGVHARIPFGEYEDVDIPGGTVGYNRLDAIVVAYKRVGGYEDVSIEVVEGEPTTGEPSINTAKLITTYGSVPTNPDGTQPDFSLRGYSDCLMYGNPLTDDKGAAVIATIKLTGVNIELVSPRSANHSINDDKPNLTNLIDRLDTMNAIIQSTRESVIELERDLTSFQRSFDDNVDARIDIKLESINTSISNLNSSVSELSNNIEGMYDDLKQQMDTLASLIGSLSSRVTALESK